MNARNLSTNQQNPNKNLVINMNSWMRHQQTYINLAHVAANTRRACRKIVEQTLNNAPTHKL